MLTAKQENARTLAAALGIPEDEAGELLRCTVVTAHDARCHFAALIAYHVDNMLKRTMDQGFDSAGKTVEVLVGNVERTVKTKGCVFVRILPDAIYIDDAYHGTSTANPNIHGVFAILSACHAAAAAVALALMNRASRCRLPVNIRPSELLGEDLSLISQPIEVGELVLAGGGAVANGFLLGLSTFDVFGRLHIVDPKKVAPGILNRCSWFQADDLGHPKSERLAIRARECFPGLEFVPHVMTINQFVRERLESRRIERLIVSVDSRRARRSLQTEFPREVYDASTTGIDEIVLHFNRRPSALACMSCIYKETEKELTHEAHVAELLGVTAQEVRSGFISDDVAYRIAQKYPDVSISDIAGRAYDTLFKQLCGIGAFKPSESRQVLAPFSFVPAIAGTYLAIELVRRVARGNADAPFNYWRASPWTSPNVELRQLRKAVHNCQFCANPAFQIVEKQIWSEY